MILCTDCCESVNGNKAVQSTTVHGLCEVCGEDFGKQTIYLEKSRTKKPEKARIIVQNMKYWDTFFTKKDEEGESIFLSEVPEDRLKHGVKKVMHLRIGPKNVGCLYAVETKKGIEFVYGYHHDGFCPAVKTTKLRR